MELKTVDLTALIPNPAQPDGRVRDTRALADSIANYGLLNPIHVTDKMVIIDGHRRMEALKLLEAKEVTVLVYNGELDKGALNHAEAMSVANSTKNFSVRNKIHVYLKGGMVSGELRRQINAYVERFGKKGLKTLQDIRLSPRTALEILELIDVNGKVDEKTFLSFVEWSRMFKLSAEINYLFRLSRKGEYDVKGTVQKMLKAFEQRKPFVVGVELWEKK